MKAGKRKVRKIKANYRLVSIGENESGEKIVNLTNSRVTIRIRASAIQSIAKHVHKVDRKLLLQMQVM